MGKYIAQTSHRPVHLLLFHSKAGFDREAPPDGPGILQEAGIITATHSNIRIGIVAAGDAVHRGTANRGSRSLVADRIGPCHQCAVLRFTRGGLEGRVGRKSEGLARVKIEVIVGLILELEPEIDGMAATQPKNVGAADGEKMV